MAKFELNIYGNNDEITKTFATDRVRWGVFLQALELQNKLEAKTPAEQFEAINEFIKSIFPDLTDNDIQNADVDDVMNTFKQLVTKANNISGGDEKNAQSGTK